MPKMTTAMTGWRTTQMARTWKRKAPEVKPPAEISLTEIGIIIRMPSWYGDDWQDGDSYQQYDDWEDNTWNDDDDDEEYETATAASEAYAAGWKAKAKASGYRQARGYKQQPTQRRQRGVDKRSTETRRQKSICSSCAVDKDIGEVIRNVLMSRQAEFLCTLDTKDLLHHRLRSRTSTLLSRHRPLHHLAATVALQKPRLPRRRRRHHRGSHQLHHLPRHLHQGRLTACRRQSKKKRSPV